MTNVYSKYLEKNTEWSIFRPEVDLYPMLIENRTNIVPKNVFELGGHHGHDSEYLRNCFDLNPYDVFVIEANSNNFNQLQNNYPEFNNINIALSNYNGKSNFREVIGDEGVSSFRKKIHLQENHPTEIKEIDVVRMDYLIDHYKIESIDICKIDVEGCGLEVLEGFGDQINKVKSIQIESEHIPLFYEQKLYPEVQNYLLSKNFMLLAYFSLGSQCDTFWVQRQNFRIK